MARKLKLLLIAGARPNFMKVAPLIKCIRQHGAEGRQNRNFARIPPRAYRPAL